MHPFFRTPRHLLYAIIFWSPFCLGMAVFLRRLTGAPIGKALLLVTPVMLVVLLFALSTWVICRYTPAGPRGFPRLALTHTTASAAMAVIGVTLFRLYAYLLASLSLSKEWISWQQKLQLSFFVLTAIIYFLGVFFNYLLMAMDRSRQAEKQLLQSELSRSRSELQALRATIHPHFLFNSLTALSVLILNDPPRGREVCLQLADFLRFTMKMTQKRLINLGEEIEHLSNYLGIEQVRLGTRLKFELQVEPGIESVQLPPMILQPLAENAIKHGIQQRLEGGTLRVEIRRRGSFLQAVVRNPLADEPPKVPGTALGMETLRKRLHDEYGDKAELRAEKEDGCFAVYVRIPVIRDEKRSKKP